MSKAQRAHVVWPAPAYLSKRRQENADYYPIFLDLLRIIDPVVVGACGLMSYAIRYHTADMPFEYFVALLLGIVVSGNIYRYLKIYSFSYLTEAPIRLFVRQMRLICIGAVLVFTIILVISYFAKATDALSRLWVSYWFVGVLLTSCITRAALVSGLSGCRKRGRLDVRVAVVGSRTFAANLAKRWAGAPGIVSRRITGIFSDHSFGGAIDFEQDPVDELFTRIRTEHFDEILVALPDNPDPAYGCLLRKLRTLPADVSVCLDIPMRAGEILPPCTPVLDSGGFKLSVARAPLSGWNIILKRIEDLALSILILVLFAPLMLLIAMLIKLDSKGPVLFRQRRYGVNNNPIEIFKFRTMYYRPWGDDDAVQARRNDDRVTRLGRFLRRSSLDELPQLLNVIEGKMSLVGPRPHPVSLNETYAELIDGYPGRHRVKPGITGWAQVNGLRGETETLEKMRQRVQCDLYYIDNWSFIFDIKIIILTAFFGFVNKNAY